MITYRDLRFITLFCLGIWALVACNGGDREPSAPPMESTQEARPGEVEAEDALGRDTGDDFGYAIAMSDHRALIGQPHDETPSTEAGVAYIYERQGNAWQEVDQLAPYDATAGDLFGRAVALHGDMAAVGAPGADHGHGVIYVFERQDDQWAQVQRLTVSQPEPADGFASAIALSGTYLLAGAPGDREAGDQAGAVYVFERRDGVWHVYAVQKLLASHAQPRAQFGRSLALDGRTALIGAPTQDDAGAAYVFDLQDGIWIETSHLQAAARQAGEAFGHAVAISGQLAVVGAPYYGSHGAAYLFEQQADGWPATTTQLLAARDINPGTQFGIAVAVAGRSVLVGAHSNGDIEHQDTWGTAYLFSSKPGERWQERYQFPFANQQQALHFGYAVALTGPHILIGAPAMLTDEHGYVYPYQDLLATMVPDSVPSDPPSPPATPSPSEEASPIAEEPPDIPTAPEVNLPPRITSTPITEAEMLHVMPEIDVTDPHLSEQTITLNGQPFTPGTAIIAAGNYALVVEATDAAGNTSRTTVHFSIEPSALP